MTFKLIFSLLSVSISSCSLTHHFSPQETLSVEYIQTANPKTDSKTAISKNNFTLIGFDQRGLKVPGLDSQQIGALTPQCSVKRLEGMGDVVRSSQHLERMKKVYRYSLSYNQEVLKATNCHTK